MNTKPLELLPIILPADPSWFPLSFNAWILLIVLFLVISLSLYFGIQYFVKKRATRKLFKKLMQDYQDNQNTFWLVREGNILLKRYFATVDKNKKILALSPQLWCDFLQKKSLVFNHDFVLKAPYDKNFSLVSEDYIVFLKKALHV